MNNKPYIKVIRFVVYKSSLEVKLPRSPKENLNLYLSSIFSAADFLSDFGGFL